MGHLHILILVFILCRDFLHLMIVAPFLPLLGVVVAAIDDLLNLPASH